MPENRQADLAKAIERLFYTRKLKLHCLKMSLAYLHKEHHLGCPNPGIKNMFASQSSQWPSPVTLAGSAVTVVPLEQSHAEDLQQAAADGELHRLWYTSVPHPESVPEEIERRLGLQASGSMLPFAIIDNQSGHAVGMTTYMNIDADNRRLEIGYTWYRKSVQRSGLNTECKFLLLRHAFETLDAIAVEFRTHALNHQSRRAIERLGAKLDGVLRNHKIIANGSLRDTAVYSIITSEWPAVKTHLQWQMEKPR